MPKLTARDFLYAGLANTLASFMTMSSRVENERTLLVRLCKYVRSRSLAKRICNSYTDYLGPSEIGNDLVKMFHRVPTHLSDRDYHIIANDLDADANLTQRELEKIFRSAFEVHGGDRTEREAERDSALMDDAFRMMRRIAKSI